MPVEIETRQALLGLLVFVYYMILRVILSAKFVCYKYVANVIKAELWNFGLYKDLYSLLSKTFRLVVLRVTIRISLSKAFML